MELVAIPTKRNSVVISIARKAAEYCKWPSKTLRKFVDFQAEYEGVISFIGLNRDFVYCPLAAPPSPARRGI